jgi:tetratricopeptide (TPR) repeat protein
LGTALTEAGRLADADRVLDAAIESAARRGDSLAEAHATVARLFVRLQVDTEAGAKDIRKRFEPLLATFVQADDDLGLGRLWRLRGLVHWIEARAKSADAAWEQAAEHSRRAGDERGWSAALVWLASSAHTGPAPVEDAIARCESIREQLRDRPRAQAMALQPLAALLAMRGEFEVARQLLADSAATIAELGVTMETAISHHAVEVALVSGDIAGAEAALRDGYARLAEMGEKALLADTAAMLAQVLYEQGRNEEARALTREAEEAAADDDLSAQIAWRTVRARLLASGGEIVEARRISGEAVELASGMDWLSDHAEALLSRGEVLRMAGETGSAAQAMQEAIALHERKGNVIGAQRARSLLAVQLPA